MDDSMMPIDDHIAWQYDQQKMAK